MDRPANQSLEEALEYMRNLPKIYIKELELNKDIFLGVTGHICDLARDEMDDSRTPKYMPLQYEMVQKYCSQGFPIKFVCEHRAQYCRTIDTAIYIYYKLLGDDDRGLNNDECKKMFGSCFFSEHDFDEFDELEDAVILCLEGDKPGRIEKVKQSGYCQKDFEENWRKKHGLLLSNQIEKGQIITDNLFLVDEYNELADKGATLKRVINFLDKLERESHERNADNVLIPYKEYHALHELLLEYPEEKANLQEEYAKLVHRLMSIFNFKAKKNV